MSAETLRPPRFDAPFVLQAHIDALPPRASCKGLFFSELHKRLASVREAAPGAGRKYLAFTDYPYADFIRLAVFAAGTLFPREPTGLALRRLGHSVYDELLATHLGRILFGVLGRDIERVLLTGPTAYRHMLNFGEVTVERKEERWIVARYRQMPALLETYQVGIVEGALEHLGAEPRIRVASASVDKGALGEMDLEVRW